MTFDELEKEILGLNIPKFRAKQIYSWLHQKGVLSFDEMTNLSKELRNKLNERYFIPSVDIEEKYVSSIDSTIKYLFRLYDGE